MQIDTSLSLDMVLTVLAVFAFIWRLEARLGKQISKLRDEQNEKIADLSTEVKTLRAELKGDITELRTELKGDIIELRTELKGDIAELRTELKGDIADLRADLRRVENKVDDCNQRVARVEGIILAREDMVDTIADSPQ